MVKNAAVVAVLFLGLAKGLAEEVHPERAAMIEKIRGTEGVRWKAAAQPRFATGAPGVSKTLCGLRAGWGASLRDAVARGVMSDCETSAAGIELPESFDSEKQWPHCAKVIGDIEDQSNCGCCWAFAGVEAASDRMCIATNGSIQLPLSPQDVCFNANSDGCGGGDIETPWLYIHRKGAVTGGQYKGSGPFGSGLCSSFSLPHCHHHGPQRDDPYPAEGEKGCPNMDSPEGPTECDASATGPHASFEDDKYSFKGQICTTSGESKIQQAIFLGGPVETGFDVYSDFENYAGGIYHNVEGDPVGGHAVKIVGWGVEDGVKYWKVANSWNPYWGEKGYFRIRRGNNEGGIEDGVVATAHTATWGKKSALDAAASPATKPQATPPPPGDCLDAVEKDDCVAKGSLCKWCSLRDVGMCVADSIPCNQDQTIVV